MTSAGRQSRYGQWSDVHAASISGSSRDQRPFFAGPQAYERMDHVRKAINYIRQSWDQYPKFMNELHELFDHVSTDDSDAVANRRLAALFSTQKSWDEKAESTREDDYSALALYSSEVGHRNVFSVINAAFRTDGLTDDSAWLRSATFLVELLNIDLFHFRDRNPDADNFTGTVYRGMCLSRDDLDRFTKAAIGPIAERYVAVPLAMVSATRNRDVAMSFAREEATRVAGMHAVLWEITVLNLDPQLLSLYRARFPRSVVTSICAVPISEVSDFPEEAEVLLRGPFFQIVGISTDSSAGSGRPVHKIEAIMHNTNRDHLTAIATNAGRDKAERDLFRALVRFDRFGVCARLAAERNQKSDADGYRSLMNEQRAKMDPYR
jgi:uncharacterized protein YjiS (DUF1127 family)